MPKNLLHCNYCKANDHTIDNCKKRKNSKEPRASPVPARKPDGFKCTICNTNTHTTSICYKNPDYKKEQNKKHEANANALLNIDGDDNCSDTAEFQIWLDQEN